MIRTISRPRVRLTAVIPLFAIALFGGDAFAEQQDRGAQADPHAKHRQMAKQESAVASGMMTLEIPIAEMVTQNSEPVDFRADVVSDRIVVLDFIYTTCTTVCPVLTAIMSQVNGQLAERIGKDVILVSMTVDPKRDTPARLKKYSSNFRTDDGWLWLTGDKLVVDGVLRKLGAYTANFEDHPAMVLVGDGRTGQWSRFVGFPGADAIVDKVEQLTLARREGAAGGG
jgi:protein SCO1/2